MLTAVSCSKDEEEIKNTDVPISATTFSSRIFREYVTANFDTNHDDGILSTEEASIVTKIDLSTNGYGTDKEKITSLKGVEYFVNLTELNVNYNRLVRLDLSKNTALVKLYCYYNQLIELNVSNSKVLEIVNCARNELPSLDVSQNMALKELDCSFNNLTRLDVSRNTALEQLDCGWNTIIALDASKNTALTHLYCYINPYLSVLKIKRVLKSTLYLDYSSTKIRSEDDITWVD